ncbi:hypothetical protein F4861DRAFT_181602 [Xylaria intraflava]|nr:hypothetical protein F4861DRAFT_181602 [Xylaria intraflava]
MGQDISSLQELECRRASTRASPYEKTDRKDSWKSSPTVQTRFEQDERRSALEFNFCPDPTEDWLAQEWWARLSVKCDDVPRLMREGFFCTSDNLIEEEGFFTRKEMVPATRPDKKKWAATRTYMFEDREQPQRWIARLDVYALHLDTLIHFDLHQMSREKVSYAVATSGEEKYIYFYVALGGEGRNFNAIYGDMQMIGLWPRSLRPKKNGDVVKGVDPEKSEDLLK